MEKWENGKINIKIKQIKTNKNKKQIKIKNK